MKLTKQRLKELILEVQQELKKEEKLPAWVIRSGNTPESFGYKNNIFIWENGTWEYGTWEYGTWWNGTWENGTWKNGLWIKGTWKNGLWIKGIWEDGIWEKGKWKNGTWWNGTWENGTWENGTWEYGTWEYGTWEYGKIWSKKYKTFVFSKVNPKKFYEIEKQSKTKEELEDKVG